MNSQLNYNNTKSSTLTESVPAVQLDQMALVRKGWASKTFLKVVLVGTFLLLVASVAINVYLDIFGLFRSVDNRKLPVYHNERMAKYLLSYRYVPANFNAVVIGTSLSDNLDFATYQTDLAEFKIYNASMMGANISEVSRVAGNLIKGGVKNIIFCVSPYQMKNTGEKEMEMNEKLYYSAIGSKNLYETYGVALIRKSGLMPFKFPKKHINEFGVNNFTERYKVKNVAEHIHNIAEIEKNIPMTIAEEAVAELKELFLLMQKEKINLIVYFHPVPIELYTSKQPEYELFQKMVGEMIPKDAMLINFNSPQYSGFRKNYEHYIDNGHLSDKGQKVIAEILIMKLNTLRSL